LEDILFWADPRARTTELSTRFSPVKHVGYLHAMSRESDSVELLGRLPDERLLAGDSPLPAAVGRPALVPASSRRGMIVGTGAAMTGITLIGGIVLFAVGAIDALADGTVFSLVLMLVGLVLAGTHWGWVHVAEFTANSVQGREARPVLDRNRQWLSAIEPYTRYEISTRVADDGSICIVRCRYRPVVSGSRSFTFVTETESEEVHSGDEPAAAVTERAELLRREAARDTDRAREQFEIVSEAYHAALLHDDDERERVAARKAASAALSERINANLRDPPLVE
jgi:hypothetical protein